MKGNREEMPRWARCVRLPGRNRSPEQLLSRSVGWCCIAERAIDNPPVGAKEKVNILLVDDQLGNLLANDVILQRALAETLIKAGSPTRRSTLLKTIRCRAIASACRTSRVELAAMIREHPLPEDGDHLRVSAIQVTVPDLLRCYAAARSIRAGAAFPICLRARPSSCFARATTDRKTRLAKR